MRFALFQVDDIRATTSSIFILFAFTLKTLYTFAFFPVDLLDDSLYVSFVVVVVFFRYMNERW